MAKIRIRREVRGVNLARGLSLAKGAAPARGVNPARVVKMECRKKVEKEMEKEACLTLLLQRIQHAYPTLLLHRAEELCYRSMLVLYQAKRVQSSDMLLMYRQS